MTLKDFVIVFVDALGQLFFSISVAMGIMVTYGSYVKKETNLMRSINQIEWFDTAVALLARSDDRSGRVYVHGNGGNVRRSGTDVCITAEDF